MIQVGAFDDKQEAKQRLTDAQIRAKEQLAQAEQFTERVAKGDKSMYRARFAGLDKSRRKPPARISSAAKFHACAAELNNKKLKTGMRRTRSC